MNRLAVALQIGFIKMTGAPLNSVQLIPATVLDHVGRSLGWGRARHRSLRFEPYTAGGVLYTTINSSPFRLWAFAICTNKSNRI